MDSTQIATQINTSVPSDTQPSFPLGESKLIGEVLPTLNLPRQGSAMLNVTTESKQKKNKV